VTASFGSIAEDSFALLGIEWIVAMRLVQTIVVSLRVLFIILLWAFIALVCFFMHHGFCRSRGRVESLAL